MTGNNLEKIINIEKWQLLQDSLAEITNMAILTIDYKGVPITNHSNCKEFCKKVRGNPELAKRCQKCDSRGGFEAVCSNKPYIYLCHYGIVDIAVPITVNEKYLGAIMAGQIKLSDHESVISLEKLHSSPTGTSILKQSLELQKLYNQIPIMSYEKVQAVSKLLFLLSDYIINATQYYDLIAITDVLSKAEKKFQATADIKNGIDIFKNSVVTALSDACIQKIQIDYKPSKNPLINQVLEYSHSNRSVMLSLTEAAALIHLSPGYFSRIFTKEFGQSYTSYMGHLKIEWAKQLLEKTDFSVTQISDELGFTDPCYFIRMFKKQEHITPLAYRKCLN